MLSLTRKVDDRIVLYEEKTGHSIAEVMVTQIKGKQVRIAFEVEKSINVCRNDPDWLKIKGKRFTDELHNIVTPMELTVFKEKFLEVGHAGLLQLLIDLGFVYESSKNVERVRTLSKSDQGT